METVKMLRELLQNPDILMAPGAYDGLSARLVELEGFPVVYASGAGIANTQFALADMGLISMGEVLTQINKIVASVNIPVIADIDTGFGNALNVYRTIQEFERAGVAAVQLEDQVSPKRCGHFTGKEVISKEEAVMKIRAAVDARKNSDLVIIARTDAIAVNGFEDAIDRARAYVEAGADAIFVEAPRTREELEEIAKLVPGVKVANIVEGGVTPQVSAEELKKMGYKIVLYANAGMRTAIRASRNTLKYLKENGHTNGVLDQMAPFKERNFVTRKPELDALVSKYVHASLEEV